MPDISTCSKEGLVHDDAVVMLFVAELTVLAILWDGSGTLVNENLTPLRVEPLTRGGSLYHILRRSGEEAR